MNIQQQFDLAWNLKEPYFIISSSLRENDLKFNFLAKTNTIIKHVTERGLIINDLQKLVAECNTNNTSLKLYGAYVVRYKNLYLLGSKMHRVVLLGDKIEYDSDYLCDFDSLDAVYKIEDLVSFIELTKAMYESNKILNNE